MVRDAFSPVVFMTALVCAGQMVHAYAARFTGQELKDLLAFYKGPQAQKIVEDEEPVASEDDLKNAQPWADGFSETVMVRIRTEMQKKGHLS